MSPMADDLAKLTPDQRAVLELKLRQRRAESAATLRIGRRADPGVHDLSFAQQRLWFVEQLHPAGAANHISAAVRIEGALSYDALARSLAEIVDRHDVLRSGYEDDRGRPLQRIHSPAPCPLPVIDVCGIGDAQLEEARRLIAAEAERPFNLTTGPLLHASLLRFSEVDHVLTLVLHHIAADGWSLGVLSQELTALYAAFLDGRPSPLAALPIQYADFAAWQRGYVDGARLTGHLEWWRSELHGLPALELPTDHPRPAVPSTRGARATIEIPRTLASALATFGQRRGVTLFMTLLAGFQTLLARWTGQTDLAVGSPVAGRNWGEVEGLIGLFVNTLVLRADLSGNPSFIDVLERVKSRVVGALTHQDVPFEQLVDQLQVERSLSHSVLTPVVFALQNVPAAALSFPGARLSVFDFERSTARFDLCLFVVETPDGLRASMEYSTDLFTADTVHRMLRCYRRLMQAMVDDPQQSIGAPALLDDDDRRRVLDEWNATLREYPRDATIPSLFARQVAARPDVVAVVCGRERLTYAQLDGRANRLAHTLREQGVGPDVRVGICLDRSVELAVALLGVLKAGGAYVPLDPAYPAQRLVYMAANAAVPFIVTRAELGALISEYEGRVVYLNDGKEGPGGKPATAPVVDLRPENLAYVSYTSGSTGLPKGVEVSHRAVIRLLFGADYVRFAPDETFLQLAPVAFDASTFEIWGALLHGARLVMYPERVPEFDDLARTLATEGITTLWLTASLFNAVVDKSPAMLRGVRQLLIGGEALSRPHVLRGMDALADTVFVNGYGPTEGTTFTCCHRIARQDVDETSASIPIGRPIANTRVFVLDAALEPVPIGVPGELCIGGDGLARGYAAAPRLTAERFVPDALSGEAGARLYRTGDLVRYREDGALEFLGRRDDQVKVRGYRIELGEIQTALMRHPAIVAAIAAVRGDQGSKTLVAYVVHRQGSTASVGELRAFLKDRLPDYMLPSAIVAIDTVPLTSSGKVDRDALPIPSVERSSERVVVAPRNEVEEIIVESCRELLAVDEVSVFDNFFDLGGHSLLVTQLASRLKRAFQTDVSIRMIFESRTLAELADGIVDKLIG
jgi:amino acid adenylation domain-containing protein